jgi:4-amino-4-deoxychorismate lyase
MATSSGVANGAAEMGDEPGLAPPIVSAEEFHRRAAANVHARAREAHLAFYSSWTDCITTDPAAMVLPMDDHMAHRGHGVFDTAHLHAGHLHMLDRHVSRFFKSMRAANIPPPFDRRVVTSLILRVAAAGGSREGQLRFYASAGPGGFALDQSECVKSVFYCVAVKKRQEKTQEKTNATRYESANESAANRGVAVVTSSVPIKPPAFATVKSTNYLPNALVVADAKRRGAQYGIWLTEDGKHVAEGPSMNAGFVVRRASARVSQNASRRLEKETSDSLGDDRDGTPIEDGMEESKTELRFLTPPWDETLAGCTVARAVELVNEGRFEHLGLKGPALIEPVSLAEARNAAELMLIGSVINCLPITRWDGTEVGEVPGVVGPVAVAMRDAIEADFETNAKELTRVPYETFETRVVKEQ